MPEEDVRLSLSNRAFQYNDGFFETIMMEGGRLRFWLDHQERMREAELALHLELPDCFWDGTLEQQLLELTQQNEVSLGRLKLQVWRAGSGLYTPQTNQVEWLATVQQAAPAPEEPIHIGVCQSVRSIHSALSHVKGPQAPLYVLAGIEKQQKQQDDMLLLSLQGYVSELISSNIYWVKENVLYTPTLDTGCVNGVSRRNILRYCLEQHMEVRELQCAVGQLAEAEAVFASNVAGLRAIASIDAVPLPTQHPLISQIRKALYL